MSSLINSLNDKGMSLQFEEFARLAEGASMKDTRVVRFLGTSDAATVHEVAVTKSDKVGKWFRTGDIKDANNEISTVVSDKLRLTEEIDNALSEESKTGVPGLGRELVAKARSFQNAFSNSGVSLQKCKSAVLEGRILDHVAGLNGVSTDEVGAWSGFTDAGRTQFINDIYRPVAPSDTKTKQPLIAEENNVFRFNIDGQNYTANKAKDKNDDIAKAIENFCNKEVHPVQTDAVFFSMAQVERWRQNLNGLREAENTLDTQVAEERAAFNLGSFIQV